MRNLLPILAFSGFAFLVSCGNEKEDPIKREQAEMKEQLDATSVGYYKALKVALRSTAAAPDDPEFAKARMTIMGFAGETFVTVQMAAHRPDSMKEDALRLLSNVKELDHAKDVLLKIDEDSLPTVTANLLVMLAGLSSTPKDDDVPPDLYKSGEHLFFAGAWYVSRRMPRPFALYELSRVKDDELKSVDLQLLAKLCRSMMYLEEKWNYMSEQSASEFIAITEKEKDYLLASPWPSIDTASSPSPEAAWHQLHGLGYLLRGVARLQMEEEVKHEEGYDDLEKFVAEAEAGGFDNELTWTAGTYVAVKKENKDKAIAYLGKLEKSKTLSQEEKDAAKEIREYMERRDAGKAMNKLNDKLAIARISYHYFAARISHSKQAKSVNKTEAGKKLARVTEEAQAFGDNIPSGADSLLEKSKEKVKGLFK